MNERARLLELIDACWTTQAIGSAAALGLPSLLANTPQRSDALARACGFHAPSLQRLLRALASLGIVIERDDGAFELTERGALLRPDCPDSLDAWARLRVSALQWPAWGELALTVQTGSSHRMRAFGRNDFHHLDAHTRNAELFHRAIAGLTATHSSLLEQFEFRKEERIVIDVGGGCGRLLAQVLLAEPHLRGIVFDLEHAHAPAVEQLAASGLGSRSEFVAGSFFENELPAGDVYLLKNVLHNWDDERSLVILERCRAAMHARSRLLVVEHIAPERMSDGPWHRTIAASDLNMLLVLSGRERTESEFRALLEAAALRATRVVAGMGQFSLIEAVQGTK
jgi:hypothetical protein